MYTKIIFYIINQTKQTTKYSLRYILEVVFAAFLHLGSLKKLAKNQIPKRFTSI